MSNDQAAVACGERSRQELSLTEAAFAGLRQAALEEIVLTPPETALKRERLIVCAQVIDAMRRALQESGIDSLVRWSRAADADRRGSFGAAALSR